MSVQLRAEDRRNKVNGPSSDVMEPAELAYRLVRNPTTSCGTRTDRKNTGTVFTPLHRFLDAGSGGISALRASTNTRFSLDSPGGVPWSLEGTVAHGHASLPSPNSFGVAGLRP
jgi:hypothetical protein